MESGSIEHRRQLCQLMLPSIYNLISNVYYVNLKEIYKTWHKRFYHKYILKSSHVQTLRQNWRFCWIALYIAVYFGVHLYPDKRNFVRRETSSDILLKRKSIQSSMISLFDVCDTITDCSCLAVGNSLLMSNVVVSIVFRIFPICPV